MKKCFQNNLISKNMKSVALECSFYSYLKSISFLLCSLLTIIFFTYIRLWCASAWYIIVYATPKINYMFVPPLIVVKICYRRKLNVKIFFFLRYEVK